MFSLLVDRELAAGVGSPHHEDVVGLHRAGSRLHGRALGKRQEVSRWEVEGLAEDAGVGVVGVGGCGPGGEATPPEATAKFSSEQRLLCKRMGTRAPLLPMHSEAEKRLLDAMPRGSSDQE
jgi:hypothetical protein